MEEYNNNLRFNINERKHIHFVGIGGISMSALAKICLNKGIKVSGSDKIKSNITEELVHLGATVFYKHNKNNISGADLVVFTCAVGENNVEVKFAKQKNILVLERADFLSEVSKEYKTIIAVAGSHGKTTVCGLLGSVLNEANKNPTVLIGGETEFGNLILGKKDFLIEEACEYRDHFLKLNHDIGVIINIDYDHPDFFETREDYEKTFQKFATFSKKHVFFDEKYSIFLKNNDISNYTTFGNNGSFSAKHASFVHGKTVFDVYKNGKYYVHISSNLIGDFNVNNVISAVAVADYLGIKKDCIKIGISKFKNLKRRFEYMGKLNGNVVIADYAHHPTQICNVLKATKSAYKKPITVVFEPHTYTRTKFLFSDFVNALAIADNLLLLPTYSAREKSIKGGTSKDLFEALKFKRSNVSFLSSYKKCKKELEKLTDNIVLILGAGSVYKLAQQIKKEYLKNTKS